MTPIALTYFILGLLTSVWPLYTLLFKRRVMGAQWLLMLAMMVVAATIILYGCLFNSFLCGEYLLVQLFMVLALSAMPLAQSGITALTSPRMAAPTARWLVVPSAVVMVLMALSVAIGGSDMYRLWISRGAEGLASAFYARSWRYNLIVSVHYYLFCVVLVAEMVYVEVRSVVQLRRFRRVLHEYYTESRFRGDDLHRIYWALAVVCLCVLLSYLFFPFNAPRPLWAVVALCAVELAGIWMVGYHVARLDTGAERLREKMAQPAYAVHKAPAQFGRQLAAYVEGERAYLNPDLSVFVLAEHFHVSQDAVVDAIHRLHGTTFGDYIDGLRVEQAATLLAGHPDRGADDAEYLPVLAHQCGYLTADALEKAFQNVMQMSVQQWCNGGNGLKASR